MRRRRDIVAVIAGCWLALGAASSGTIAPAAASGGSTATAPGQLTNAYPLGPQRLCCAGQTATHTQSGTRPPASVPPATGRTRPRAGAPRQHASSGVPAALLIGLGVVALLLIAVLAATYDRRRRSVPPAPVPLGQRPVADSASLPAASETDEHEYRRLDANGDAGGAFNLGVMLHERGDVAGATAAYERAEGRGDPDAAFNLGVLLYELGDLDGATAAWRRSAERGHARAAANLVFVSSGRDESHPDEWGPGAGAFNLGVVLHQQGDVAEAIASYERAEQRGHPDAAFNLGVLLYESGDLDGAAAAWRRSADRGHTRAAANLEFLQRHRHELNTAGRSGEASDDQ